MLLAGCPILSRFLRKGGFRSEIQSALNLPHRPEQLFLLRRREPFQHGRDLLTRPSVERSKDFLALSGERKKNPPPVGRTRRRLNQSLLFEALQHAAQVSPIQPEFLAKLDAGDPLAMRQLIQHANFSQRKLAVQQMFLQNTDLASVEAIEAANGLDRVVRIWSKEGSRRGRHTESIS